MDWRVLGHDGNMYVISFDINKIDPSPYATALVGDDFR